MEIFRFIGWQWRRMHRDTKQGSLIFLVALATAIFCWVSAASFPASILLVIGAIIVTTGIVFLWEETRTAWISYKEVKAAEAERIVKKLSRRY